MTPRFFSYLLVASFLSLSGCTRSTPSSSSGADSPKTQAIGIGSQAPALQAIDHRGQSVDLRADGAPVTLVYFYPKNNTPG